MRPVAYADQQCCGGGIWASACEYVTSPWGYRPSVPFEQEFASIYTIREGLVAEAHLFLSWARARDAARLPPS